ncbi:MAG: hypothetical protein FWF77_00275 [Defluviitaleaceae bacterium]|nr:hypothetical protein [Defluviitaleaceae bacterium]
MNEQHTHVTESEPKKSEPKENPLALVSMILGIASIVTVCCGGFPMGVAAIVLAVICKKDGVDYDTRYTTAGVITGIIGIILQVILVVIYLAFSVGHAVFSTM